MSGIKISDQVSELQPNISNNIIDGFNPQNDLKIKILHVDDDESHLLFTKLILEQNNQSYTVKSFNSPEGALHELNETNYDCLISDYDMPRMNGLQLARKVREISDIPLILYTGKGSEEVAESAFGSGVNSYVRKEPTNANFKVLCQTIQNVVERHWSKRLLIESESRFRRLVEDSPLPMSVTIGDKIVFVNPKRVELTGHSSPESIVGMSGLTFVHPDDVERLRKRLKSRAEGSNVSQTVVYRLRCLDGSIIYVEDHMSSTLWESRPAVLHSLVDFTDRIQYEELLIGLQSYGVQL